jgi:hypothetical protein
MTKKQLKDQLSQLQDWARDVRDDVSKHPSLPRDDKDELADDTGVRKALTDWAQDPRYQRYLDWTGGGVSADARAPELEPDSIKLQNFLGQMSTAMVEAQSMLDTKSAEYLAATAGKGHILPSVFRVPKLTAQMRFAVEVEKGKEINLLFYKREEKATSRNEQAIDFDVVSVPAPPGAADALRFFGPRMDLLLDPFEREGVIDAIKKLNAADLSKLAEDESDRLVILTLPAQEKRRDYLILGVTAVKEHSVGLWHLTVPEKGTAVLTNIYPLNRKNAEHEKFLKDVIDEVARRQEEYFSD